jgi:Glycosyl transferases group 1
VTVLLVGARLAAPVERYGLAPVAGPQVLTPGEYVAAGSPGALAGVLGRAALRRLPAGTALQLRGARHGADAVLGAFTARADNAWCAGYIARTRPDAVLIDTIFRAGLLAEAELAKVNSVIIAHDVFHRRHLALTAAGYRVRPAELTREMEIFWLRRARHIAAIQPEEAKLLAGICPAQNVFTAPMPAIPAPPPGQAPLPGRLVFVGSATLPNLDGLRWFLEKTRPRLHIHGLTLDLVGDCGAALRQLPAGVMRLGRIENLAPVLHRAALAISPLRVGSGLKIKLLDYARHGLFTVATPPSLEGFTADDQAPLHPGDYLGSLRPGHHATTGHPSGSGGRPALYFAPLRGCRQFRRPEPGARVIAEQNPRFSARKRPPPLSINQIFHTLYRTLSKLPAKLCLNL